MTPSPTSCPSAPVQNAASRSEQFESRLEQSESRLEPPASRSEQFESRSEQFESRSEQFESRSEQFESRLEPPASRSEQSDSHLLSAPRSLVSRRDVNRALLWGGIGVATGGLSIVEVAHAASWEKIDSDDGIDVFKKDIPGSKLHAFRGTAIVDAPMEKIMWVLADNTHRTEWVDRLKKSIVLEKKSDYEFVIYQHFGSPPIVSDRDFVYAAKAYSNKDGSGVLEINSIAHPKAPPTVGVRGELRDCSYSLSRKGDKTHVDVSIVLDPKGALPAWLVNLVQKSWPMNTLTGLRKQVKKGFVGSLPAPPVR